MIHITAAEGKYYFSDVVILTSGQSMNVDEQTLTLDQLEGLKDGYETGRLIMTSGDYTKLLTTIEDKQYGGGTAPYPELPVATKNSLGGVIVSDYLKIDTSGQLSVDFETIIEATVESATSGLEQTLGAQYTQIIPIGNSVIIDGTPKFGHSVSVKLIENTSFELKFPQTNEDYTLDVYIGTTSARHNIYTPSNDVTLVAQFKTDVLAYSEPKFYVNVFSDTSGTLIYNAENLSHIFNFTNDTSWLNIIAVFNDGIDQDKVRELTLDGLDSFPIRINTFSQANFPTKLVEAFQETETTFNTQLNNYALKTEIPLLERTPSSNTLPVLANRVPLYSLGTDGNFVLCTPNAWIKLDENLFMPAYTGEVLGLHP